ncbi:hypothetical protein [Metamycoplasma hominis]|uniref:hypothetical protein n=1 Tax=Metamycoplasma hominis TaxID=2098 RepID=UPI001E5F1251|nr:hypothetical protein [Metamycoplasma hominis]
MANERFRLANLKEVILNEGLEKLALGYFQIQTLNPFLFPAQEKKLAKVRFLVLWNLKK